MKYVLAVLFSCYLFFSTTTVSAQDSRLMPVQGATVADNRLYLYGVPAYGCVKSATTAYRTHNDTLVFVVGCDDYSYVYRDSTRNFSLITNSTRLAQVLSAFVDDSNYVVLRVVGTGGSYYNVGTGIYLGWGYPAFQARVVNNQLFVDGQVVSYECVKSVTRTFNFGRHAYVFVIGCNDHPYVFSSNQRVLSLITSSTSLAAIHSAFVDHNGYIVLQVTGTGGSYYNVNTYIYVNNY